MSDLTGAGSTAAPGLRHWVTWPSAMLLALGLLARLSPLLDWRDRLPWQYLSEDGYLMQTVARNMAIGLGMSTADGTISTNGVQPLATFIFAALHWLAGGDKTFGLVAVTIASMLASVLAALLLFALLRRLFDSLPDGRALALLATSVWFAAPLIIRHSMNGLETGIYHAAILASLLVYLRWADAAVGAWTLPRRLALGAVLGLTFLARNDAVFFIGALLSAHVVVRTPGASTLAMRSMDALIAGLTSLVVASPWLISNYLRFGSIVPVSGAAQARTSTGLGSNLPVVPANLFENTFVFLPLPDWLELRLPVMAVCLLLVAAVLVAWWRLVAWPTIAGRRIFVAWVLFAAAMVAYYGVYFGARWFVPRYLSPLSLLLWPAALASGVMLARRITVTPPLAWRRSGQVAIGAVVLVCSALAWTQFRHGHEHMHRQVVDWVRPNVAPQTWVGAVQTGTLGYFHDRTLNLDGKVNPQALRVLQQQGHVLDYVVDSKIDYVVDWVGMADWGSQPGGQRFAEQFRVRVKDPGRNLAVVERIVPVTPAAPR